MELKCFACGRDGIYDEEGCSDGQIFIGHGGYGSDFDPMDRRRFLKIIVCNECLRNMAAEGRILLGEARPSRPVSVTKPWAPGEEELAWEASTSTE